MATEVEPKKKAIQAAKKGLMIGLGVSVFGIIANVAFVLMQPALPECESDVAIVHASLQLNSKGWMRSNDLKVESLQDAELVAANEARDVFGCRATMNTTAGKSFPVVYRIEWDSEPQGTFVVQADIER